MTAASQRSRAKVEPRRLLVRILFAILILVPIVALFTQVRQATADRESFAGQERLGIEFLRTLDPLTSAVVQAQSAAVAGTALDATGLARAIAAVSAADARLGGVLLTHERWTGLRGKIEALSNQEPARGQPAYDAYGEVTDLMLALYHTVRENSGLIRDPKADGFFLQHGVCEHLPELRVAMGRFADLTLIVARLPLDDRTPQLARLYSAQSQVTSLARDLAQDLQAAVAASESTTLGTDLFKLFDGLRLAMDSVSSTPILADADVTLVDVNTLAALRAKVVETLEPLSPSVLDELDTLIQVRLDQVATDVKLAAGAFGLAVVIALLPTLSLIVSGLRRRPINASAGRHGRPEPPDAEPEARAPQPAHPAQSSMDPDGVTGPRERERSGAAR
jgi:hypothetical protein